MLKRLLFVCALAGSIPGAALAQSAVVTGIGPRIGVSLDPDQIVFGGQAVIGEVAPSVTFDPGVEVGFGDDQTLIAFNLDMHYHFQIQGSQWRPYGGLGLGVNFFSFDNPPPFRDDSETNVGGNVILGAGVPTRTGSRFFTEARFGLGDIPSLKLLVGWHFRV